jgi:hypothetical protein
MPQSLRQLGYTENARYTSEILPMGSSFLRTWLLDDLIGGTASGKAFAPGGTIGVSQSGNLSKIASFAPGWRAPTMEPRALDEGSRTKSGNL